MHDLPDVAQVDGAKRRSGRWIWGIGCVITAMMLGGIYWRFRLNTDERFLVGHWRGTAFFSDGTQQAVNWEFLTNRRVYSNGAW